MVKQREGHRLIFSDLANQRIKEDCCPTCGKPKSEWARRKEWRCCCKDCTDRFWREQVKIFGWADLRKKCFERDNWNCVRCGKKFIAMDGDTYRSNFIADHIFAIALGGEEWDINNLQTLCIKCNKIKTAEDAGKIARLREIERKQSNGQKQLGFVS